MGIAVELMPDPGAPSAGIVVDGYTAATLTVQWSVDNVKWQTVAGGHQVDSPGGVFLLDYFPPLRQPVTYRVLVVDGGPVSGPLETVVTFDSSQGYLQSASDPSVFVQLDIREAGEHGYLIGRGDLLSGSMDQAVDYALVIGADRPHAAFGTRLAAADLPLTVSVPTAADGGQFARVLSAPGPLVLRGAVGDLLDPVTYFAAPRVTPSRSGIASEGGVISEYSMTVTPVQPTSPLIVTPRYDFDDLDEMYAGLTFADLDAAIGSRTFVDLDRDPRP